MESPTIDDFPPGAAFQVDAGEFRPTLTVDRAEPLPRSAREGGGFRLEFVGPAEPILPQGTYGFSGPGGAVSIFIVPVGREPAGIRYEAIFY